MTELEKQLREMQTQDLQNAIRSDTLTSEAVEIVKVILQERGAAVSQIGEPIVENKDILAQFVIGGVGFALSSPFVGTFYGCVIAIIVGVLITNALPTRSNGKKLPMVFSIALLIVSIIIFIIMKSATIRMMGAAQ